MVDDLWLDTEPFRCYWYPGRDCPGWAPGQRCDPACLRVQKTIPRDDPDEQPERGPW